MTTDNALERLRERIDTDRGRVEPVSMDEIRALLDIAEAAQAHYDEWARVNPNDLSRLPLPIQRIGAALAALEPQSSPSEAKQ